VQGARREGVAAVNADRQCLAPADGPILAAAAARLAAALITPVPPCTLRADGEVLGRFDAARMARLSRFDAVFRREGDVLAFAPGLDTPAARTAVMEDVARTLAAEGALTAWRNERYAARTAFERMAAFEVERAAARYLGLHTYAAHVNGLVDDAGAHRMWLARRSPTKAIDPRLLDNLVGGGIPAGEPVEDALVREAWEEAGVPAAQARGACRGGQVEIARAVPDGWQRETIFTFDLVLPPSFTPANQDGEAVEHRLVDLGDVAGLIANDSGDDVVTIDASLVIVDCLLRHGAVAEDARERRLLDALCLGGPRALPDG
jgi:8-oxo-dGTP pyrophosphatase MutT (NUDIX family)